MSVSARLTAKSKLALARYCKTHGVTKTEALERGIALLLRHEGERARHPAYASFERLALQLPTAVDEPQHRGTSSAPLKRHLDAKYPA
jgi:hypothetical protein